MQRFLELGHRLLVILGSFGRPDLTELCATVTFNAFQSDERVTHGQLVVTIDSESLVLIFIALLVDAGRQPTLFPNVLHCHLFGHVLDPAIIAVNVALVADNATLSGRGNRPWVVAGEDSTVLPADLSLGKVSDHLRRLFYRLQI